MKLSAINLTAIVVALVSLIGTIANIVISYRWNRKDRLFQAYFEKKSESYDAYLRLFSELSNIQPGSSWFDEGSSVQTINLIVSAQSKVKLYCSEEMVGPLEALTAIAVNGITRKDIKDVQGPAYHEVVCLMREDIKRCAKFKFK